MTDSPVEINWLSFSLTDNTTAGDYKLQYFYTLLQTWLKYICTLICLDRQLFTLFNRPIAASKQTEQVENRK